MDEYQFSYEEYKKKVCKNHGLSFYVIGFFTILLIGLAVLLWPKTTINNTTSYYFVEIDNFSVYSDANTLAGEIQSRLGAGYIYFDGSYHVLAAYYPTKDEAQTVVDNLMDEYPNSKIFNVECNSFSQHNNLTANQNKIVIETIKENNQNFLKIYENILKFDKNEINISILRQNFTNFSSSYNKIYNELKQNFSENSKYKKAVDNIYNINNALSQFNEFVYNNEIYKLKYNLIKIVMEHCAFVNSF